VVRKCRISKVVILFPWTFEIEHSIFDISVTRTVGSPWHGHLARVGTRREKENRPRWAHALAVASLFASLVPTRARCPCSRGWVSGWAPLTDRTPVPQKRPVPRFRVEPAG
jgi:hypothetical protein